MAIKFYLVDNEKYIVDEGVIRISDLVLWKMNFASSWQTQWVINLVIGPGHQTKIGPVKYQNGVQKRI